MVPFHLHVACHVVCKTPVRRELQQVSLGRSHPCYNWTVLQESPSQLKPIYVRSSLNVTCLGRGKACGNWWDSPQAGLQHKKHDGGWNVISTPDGQAKWWTWSVKSQGTAPWVLRRQQKQEMRKVLQSENFKWTPAKRKAGNIEASSSAECLGTCIWSKSLSGRVNGNQVTSN